MYLDRFSPSKFDQFISWASITKKQQKMNFRHTNSLKQSRFSSIEGKTGAPKRDRMFVVYFIQRLRASCMTGHASYSLQNRRIIGVSAIHESAREVPSQNYPPVVTPLFMLFQLFAWRTVCADWLLYITWSSNVFSKT